MERNTVPLFNILSSMARLRWELSDVTENAIISGKMTFVGFCICMNIKKVSKPKDELSFFLNGQKWQASSEAGQANSNHSFQDGETV